MIEKDSNMKTGTVVYESDLVWLLAITTFIFGFDGEIYIKTAKIYFTSRKHKVVDGLKKKFS